MSRHDVENKGQGKAAAHVPVLPTPDSSESAAVAAENVQEIPEQPAAAQKPPATAQKQPAAKQPAVAQKIPISLLVPSPYNSRRFRTQRRIKEIAQSLSAHGQREALRVYRGTGDFHGKFVIVSGVTRFLAAKTLGWSALDAIIDPTLNSNVPLVLVRLSRLHNDTLAETDMDHAAIVADLEDKEGYSQGAIMAAMGFNTPRKLLKLKSFRELPKAIFNIAAQNPDKFTVELAEMLNNAVSSLGEDKAVLLANELVAENLSGEQLIGRIRVECRKIASTPVRAKKERTALIHLGDTKVGNLRVMRYPDSDKRRVKLDVQLPEDAAKNFFIELESLIQKMKGKW
ncbi:MAG: ParB N-terminal domain-containing protein [Betaproteobacteria bacterium]|nr:ParB N-terminal domain-containing protein [Betaproteobacteria bacterium]